MTWQNISGALLSRDNLEELCAHFLPPIFSSGQLTASLVQYHNHMLTITIVYHNDWIVCTVECLHTAQ